MKTIPLTQGKVAIVDDEDFEKLSKFKWIAHCNKKRKTKNWYATRTLKSIKMHRVILNAPSNMIVDHINGNGLDNRRSNIRLSTYSHNSANMKKYEGTSKYKGVSWMKNKKSWLAQINSKGKHWYLGRFKNEEDAAIVYNVAAQLVFGKFARLNNV